MLGPEAHIRCQLSPIRLDFKDIGKNVLKWCSHYFFNFLKNMAK